MPTIPMNSKSWPRFILPVMRREWEQKRESVVSPLTPFFSEESSSSAEEYSQGIGNFGLVSEYNAVTAEGNPAVIPYDAIDPLYETTFTHKEYVKGTAIERKLVDDNRTGVIIRRAQRLGLSFGTTVAVHRSSVLNNSFSATVVGGDSKALCATDHPVNSRSSTTFSNKGTSALSYESVVATIIAGQDMVDDRGNPMPSIFDVLYVPTAQQATAYEIVKAISKPGTGDNDANALNFMVERELKVKVDPYLTNSLDWWMIDSVQSPLHLLWFWRVRPDLAIDPSSDFNLVARYRGYMRYSFGWDDAHWIYGHDVP